MRRWHRHSPEARRAFKERALEAYLFREGKRRLRDRNAEAWFRVFDTAVPRSAIYQTHITQFMPRWTK